MKIYPLQQLTDICAKLKAGGKTVVQCHGCFDVLHIGHVKHLETAKRMGDVLIVTVTADPFVNKGPNRPVFNEDYRAEMLEALTCVDYVAINDGIDAAQAILILKPDFYVKGADYAKPHTQTTEELATITIGGRVRYTTTEKFSTTELLEALQ